MLVVVVWCPSSLTHNTIQDDEIDTVPNDFSATPQERLSDREERRGDVNALESNREERRGDVNTLTSFREINNKRTNK